MPQDCEQVAHQVRHSAGSGKQIEHNARVCEKRDGNCNFLLQIFSPAAISFTIYRFVIPTEVKWSRGSWRVAHLSREL